MQLAQQRPNLHIIGLGAQDGIDQANNFVEQSGTGTGDITMVWDPSFESWRHFGVRSQPYWMLFGADGELRFSAPGAIDFDTVAAELA